jgi:predicted lipoprotein with Yx(FWY)xxD motif
MPQNITAPRSVLATATIALAVVLGACGSSSSSKASDTTKASSETTTTTAATSSTTASAANALASAPAPGSHFDTTISFVKLPGNGGLILVGPNGHSLYVFDRDQGTTSACTGGCQTVWPALTASGTPTVATGLDASKAGTAAGGQVTYNGHLLYYYAADNNPGDTNGVTIPNWHLVSPLGTAMTGG